MKRAVADELMDGPLDPSAELAQNLNDIAFANRAFGGVWPVMREFRRVDARTLLDVCCGDADVALTIVRDARRRGRPIGLTVVDRSDSMLALARRRAGDERGVTFVAADATALPFADGAFDVVTCTLALHHFEPGPARAMLRELRRVARLVPIVSDLRRSWLGYAAALGWSRIGSRNRLTRHDAPLSVRRAYTVREVRALAREAGWRAPRVRDEAFFRLTASDALEDGR